MNKKEFQVDGIDFNFLIGKKINKVIEKNSWGVDEYILVCDDCIITITTNEGCGGCGNGWSSIKDLKKLEGNSVITNVVCKYSESEWSDKFKLFIYYHDKTLEIEGDDGYGNGYYGGGFYVTFKDVEVK